MTPPVSTSNQVPCFLPEDPPHRMKSPPSTVSTLMRLNQTSPLITFSTLLPPQRYFPLLNQLLPSSIDFTRPPLNVSTLPPSFQMLPPTQRFSPLPLSILPRPSATLLPPPSTPPPSSPTYSTPLLSTLPPSNVSYVLPPSMLQPSNVINARQPSNVTLVRPSYSASFPLPTMLLFLFLTHFRTTSSHFRPPFRFRLTLVIVRVKALVLSLKAHPSSPQISLPSRYAGSGRQGPQSLACFVTLVRIVIVQGTSNMYKNTCTELKQFPLEHY